MDPRLGTAARFQQAKNYSAAEQIYRQILQTQPKNADALLLLGLLLHETGRHEPAIEALRKALRSQPNQPEIRQTLVGPLIALNRIPEAIIEAREVVRLKPMVFESHFALAKLLERNRDFTAGLPSVTRSIQLNAKYAPAHALHGQILIGLRRLEEALAAMDRALRLDAKLIDALVDRGYVMKELGRVDAAIASYTAALELAPQNLAALNNLGGCYLLKARAADALRCFEAAVQLAPQLPKPRNNLGAVLKEIGHLDEAIPHFELALQLDPTYGEAASNLASSLAMLGQHERAIAAFGHALRVTPAFAPALSNQLAMRIAMPDVPREVVFAEHQEFGRRYSDPLIGERRPLSIDKEPDRPLRIGYVSPDFREHSVRYFIEPVLAGHDRSQVRVFCYATGVRRDETTARVAALADEWHSATGLTDDQFADLIRSHQIDILVDLAGHTAEHSLLVFARRPAPVQVTYLGYPTTTGMDSIDYRLTDTVADPPGAEVFYTEKLSRLPNAFFVYMGDSNLRFDPVLPADRNGFVTFGSFNSFAKINPDLLDSWAQILAAVPNSRLLMKSKPLENPSTRQWVHQAFARRGVLSDRVQMQTWVRLDEHYALLRSVDLMLDSYPYNGHTTSCQSIWMGVPVMTRAGDTFRSRVGLSMMTQLDLPEFVATSREQYVKRAIEFGSDLPRLRELRPTLRQRMSESSLCDAKTFCRQLESVYREMWHTDVTMKFE
jgi:protein O-GlcNAc transferase